MKCLLDEWFSISLLEFQKENHCKGALIWVVCMPKLMYDDDSSSFKFFCINKANFLLLKETCHRYIGSSNHRHYGQKLIHVCNKMISIDKSAKDYVPFKLKWAHQHFYSGSSGRQNSACFNRLNQYNFYWLKKYLTQNDHFLGFPS